MKYPEDYTSKYDAMIINYKKVKVNEWQKVGGIIYLQTCRAGWRGILDILHSMITRTPLYTIAQRFEIELYAKTPTEGAHLQVCGVRLEGRHD